MFNIKWKATLTDNNNSPLIYLYRDKLYNNRQNILDEIDDLITRYNKILPQNKKIYGYDLSIIQDTVKEIRKNARPRKTK